MAFMWSRAMFLGNLSTCLQAVAPSARTSVVSSTLPGSTELDWVPPVTRKYWAMREVMCDVIVVSYLRGQIVLISHLLSVLRHKGTAGVVWASLAQARQVLQPASLTVPHYGGPAVQEVVQGGCNKHQSNTERRPTVLDRLTVSPSGYDDRIILSVLNRTSPPSIKNKEC